MATSGPPRQTSVALDTNVLMDLVRREESTIEAIDLIRKIRANGTTIIIIEHIMHVIMTISDRIHAINFGQTIAEGTPKEVAANQAVIEAYLGTDYA